MQSRVRFTASKAPAAQEAFARLTSRYGQSDQRRATVIVALGGDGFMLQTLHAQSGRDLPVYGMNCGTIGFLMNAYSDDSLTERLAQAEEALLNPLSMRAENVRGKVSDALAVNEVSLLRQGPQAARLRVSIDGRERLSELVCDGALLATPAGSTACRRSTTYAAGSACCGQRSAQADRLRGRFHPATGQGCGPCSSSATRPPATPRTASGRSGTTSTRRLTRSHRRIHRRRHRNHFAA